MKRICRLGFTLVERLVVIVIIAIIISLLLPALQQARATAQSAQCLSNERQFGFALYQYLNDWDGYIPHYGEGGSFQTIGRPDRNYIDMLSEYFGITSSFDLGVAGSFPGFVLSDDPLGYDIWNCPAREPYLPFGNKGYRWGSYHYGYTGGPYLFTAPNLRHDHVDNVSVPAKTMWLHGNNSATSRMGIWHWRYGAHSGGANFTFIVGHAETASVEPFNDYWAFTGGDVPVPPEKVVGVCCAGELMDTYPPELNVADQLAGEEWWLVPWYLEPPFFDSQ